MVTCVSLWRKSSGLRRDDVVFRSKEACNDQIFRDVCSNDSCIKARQGNFYLARKFRQVSLKEKLVQYSSCSFFRARSRFISFIKRDCQPSRRENPFCDTYLVRLDVEATRLALAPCSATPSQYISTSAGYFRLDIPSAVRHGGRACFPGRAR